MIVTLTPNPSLDRTIDVERLEVGAVQRATDTRVDAGGKGINVSRILVRHAVPSTAVLPVGGRDGEHLTALLAEVGVPAVTVPISGSVRSNVTVVEADGTTTKLNTAGPVLVPAEARALLTAVDEQLAAGARWLVVAGSLPAGLDDAFVADTVALAAARGVPTALDTSGPVLARAVEAGGLGVIKPNDEELAELVGTSLTTVGDVVTAARRVRATSGAEVLVSLGRHGALLVTEATWWAGGAPLVARSTVGAGDSTLAGYLSAPRPGGEALVRAVAWGRAAALMPGTAVPGPQDIDLGDVRLVADPDPATPLKEL